MNRFAPLAVLSLLAACAELPPDSPPPPDDGAGICDASTLGWATGKHADAALLGKAKADSGARIVRTLQPGQMVTMEYSPYRLNLYLDADGRVERASCG
jgi:hypothetical protein